MKPNLIVILIDDLRFDETSASGHPYMANHHLAVTARYYFPGMYTAILPMILGICAVWWMFRNRNVKLAA